MTTLLPILSLAIVLGGVLFYLHPKFIIPASLTALPFQRLGAFPLNPAKGFPIIQPIQVVAAAAILGILALLIREHALEPFKKLRVPLTCLAIVMLCGVIGAWQVHYFQTWVDLLSASIAIGFCLALAMAVRYTNWRQTWLWLAAITLIVCAFGMYQFIGDSLGLPLAMTGLLGRYSHVVFGFPRIQSTMAEPLFFANFLLLPLFVGLSMLIHDRKYRVFTAITLTITTISLVLTLSRGAFIAAAIALPVWVWCSRRTLARQLASSWQLVTAIVAAILLAAILLLMASSVLVGKSPVAAPLRFFGLITTQANQTATLTDRFRIQQQALQIFKEKPVFGLGIGGYSFRVEGYPAVRSTADRVAINNEFIELVVEVGTVGLLAYLAFIAATLYGLWRARLVVTQAAHRAWVIGCLAALVGTLVQYQSFSGFFLYQVWLLLGLGIGLAAFHQSVATA